MSKSILSYLAVFLLVLSCKIQDTKRKKPDALAGDFSSPKTNIGFKLNKSTTVCTLLLQGISLKVNNKSHSSTQDCLRRQHSLNLLELEEKSSPIPQDILANIQQIKYQQIINLNQHKIIIADVKQMEKNKKTYIILTLDFVVPAGQVNTPLVQAIDNMHTALSADAQVAAHFKITKLQPEGFVVMELSDKIDTTGLIKKIRENIRNTVDKNKTFMITWY